MKKAKEIVNSWWFKSASIGAIGAALLFLKGGVLFAGIAFGMAIRELLFAFRIDEAVCKCCPCYKDCKKEEMLKS